MRVARPVVLNTEQSQAGDAAGQAGSHHLRQLCDAQTRYGPTLAGPEPAISRALHADQRILVEYGGAVLPGPPGESFKARRVPQSGRVDPGGGRLHRSPQPQSQAVHLDRFGARHPAKVTRARKTLDNLQSV
jgi:hypothetical protein